MKKILLLFLSLLPTLAIAQSVIKRSGTYSLPTAIGFSADFPAKYSCYFDHDDNVVLHGKYTVGGPQQSLSYNGVFLGVSFSMSANFSHDRLNGPISMKKTEEAEYDYVDVKLSNTLSGNYKNGVPNGTWTVKTDSKGKQDYTSINLVATATAVYSDGRLSSLKSNLSGSQGGQHQSQSLCFTFDSRDRASGYYIFDDGNKKILKNGILTNYFIRKDGEWYETDDIARSIINQVVAANGLIDTLELMRKGYALRSDKLNISSFYADLTQMSMLPIKDFDEDFSAPTSIQYFYITKRFSMPLSYEMDRLRRDLASFQRECREQSSYRWSTLQSIMRQVDYIQRQASAIHYHEILDSVGRINHYLLPHLAQYAIHKRSNEYGHMDSLVALADKSFTLGSAEHLRFYQELAHLAHQNNDYPHLLAFSDMVRALDGLTDASLSLSERKKNDMLTKLAVRHSSLAPRGYVFVVLDDDILLVGCDDVMSIDPATHQVIPSSYSLSRIFNGDKVLVDNDRFLPLPALKNGEVSVSSSMWVCRPFRTGSIMVSSSPGGAKVEVNGVYNGFQTPCVLSPVPVGDYAIAVTYGDEYQTHMSIVSVMADSSHVVDCELQKIPQAISPSLPESAPMASASSTPSSPGAGLSSSRTKKNSGKREFFIHVGALCYPGAQLGADIAFVGTNNWGFFIQGGMDMQAAQMQATYWNGGSFAHPSDFIPVQSTRNFNKLSLGAVYRCGKHLDLLLGAGVGDSECIMEYSSLHGTSSDYVRLKDYNQLGVCLETGVFINRNSLSFSATVGTLNLGTLYGQFGVGFRF